MFTRRVATFVLGMWIGCCLMMDLIVLQSQRFADLMVTNPAEGAKKVVDQTTSAASLLYHHMAGEWARAYLANWEGLQFVLALVVVLLLVLSDQKKILPLVLTGFMVIFLLVQYFVLTPDYTALGRQADFLDESASYSLRTRMLTTAEVYGGLEAMKLAFGGGLASYLFAMQSTVMRKRRRSTDVGHPELDATGQKIG